MINFHVINYKSSHNTNKKKAMYNVIIYRKVATSPHEINLSLSLSLSVSSYIKIDVRYFLYAKLNKYVGKILYI